MLPTRNEPYPQQIAENTRRWEQLRTARRNQIFGVLLIALAILLVALLRTNPRWIFPSGWWRP